MNCFHCKGKMKDSTTTHVVKLEACIIIIKNVPCIECTQCGATYFNNDVALQLERVVKDTKTVLTEIAIINFPAA